MRRLSDMLVALSEGLDYDRDPEGYELVEDCRGEVAAVRAAIVESLQYLEVEPPGEDDFHLYRRRDLVRRLRGIAGA
jgi:hypothetical protein